MDANQLMGWVEYGGGKELFAEIQQAARLNLVSYLGGPVPCEPMGWFKKEIKGPADLKGIKFRTSGLAVDMIGALGMATVQMAPADIVPPSTAACSTARSSRAPPTTASWGSRTYPKGPLV